MDLLLRTTVAASLVFSLYGCASQLSGPVTGGMSPYAKDLIDAIAKLAGLVTIAVGLIGLLHQVRKNRAERKEAESARDSRAKAEQLQKEKELNAELQNQALRREELRWRKAMLAREVLNEMLRDHRCQNAMRMIDWDGWEFEVKGGKKRINHEEVRQALRVHDLNFEPHEGFVRDAFESFFDHMQMTEHFIGIGLLEFEDIRYPYSYYVTEMRNFRSAIDTFLKFYRYEGALALFGRFNEWTSAGAG